VQMNLRKYICKKR